MSIWKSFIFLWDAYAKVFLLLLASQLKQKSHNNRYLFVDNIIVEHVYVFFLILFTSSSNLFLSSHLSQCPYFILLKLRKFFFHSFYWWVVVYRSIDILWLNFWDNFDVISIVFEGKSCSHVRVMFLNIWSGRWSPTTLKLFWRCL